MKFWFSALKVFSGLLLLWIMPACQQVKPPATQQLHDGWQLINPLTQEQFIATVPGNVFTDLMQAGIIPDPFFGTNEDSVQWVAKQKWIYQTVFEIESELKGCEHIDLVFEGLDTYAQVYLNGTLILEADNMFRQWQVDVKPLLVNGKNILRILFHPADSVLQTKTAHAPFQLPESRAHSRKAPFQFGWDWGPAFPTMGIWKPVKLISWNDTRILGHTIHQLSVDSTKAELLLEVELLSSSQHTYRLQLTNETHKYVDQLVNLEEGSNRIQLPFEIESPTRWWPNGLGKQHLYNFHLKLSDGNKLYEELEFSTGVRQIELITEADSIGESFYFKVNGRPIFIKGANYIPEDIFLNRTSRDKTLKLLSDAADVHMNMIRVWGGGIYPDDYFYEIADSLGLLIWQDFMFACTMYPFDDEFLENVKQEATQQIKRIRKHPSIALWCGNNEVDEGFHNWGWQQSLEWSPEDSTEIWQGYLKLFEEMLPELVNELDPYRPYWPSSPSTGWGKHESLKQGDIHYWGVWWGEEPFEVYEEKVGRFHSEYGFQGMPQLATFEAFTYPDDRYIGSPVLESHQKHPRGTRLIDAYMNLYYPVPKAFEDYLFMSQLVQSYGVVKAIEAHRRAMPSCMGTLYWQLNDCWPVTSWSSVDYYGRWKALHYHLKQAYAPIVLSVETSGDSLSVFVVNNTHDPLEARIGIDLKNFSGQVLYAFSGPVSMSMQGVKKIKTLSTTELLQGVDKQMCMLYLSLFTNSQTTAEKVYHFVAPKDLKLNQAKPVHKIAPRHDHVEISLYSEQLIKSIMLQSNDPDGFFEDNYFDLLPNKQRIVHFIPSGMVEINQLKFDISSLNEIMHKP